MSASRRSGSRARALFSPAERLRGEPEQERAVDELRARLSRFAADLVEERALARQDYSYTRCCESKQSSSAVSAARRAELATLYEWCAHEADREHRVRELRVEAAWRPNQSPLSFPTRPISLKMCLFPQ